MHDAPECDAIAGPLIHFCRHHLPGEAEFIFQPAALHFLAAVARELLPVVVNSSCISQLIAKETASVNLNCGPPFNPTNSGPFSSKFTVRTEPFSPKGSSPV